MKPSLIKNIANLTLYQGVWFASVLGAAKGWRWPGVAALGVMVMIHMVIFPKRRGLDIATGAVGVVIGLIADTTVTALGAMSFPTCDMAGSVTPLFMLAMWAAFALMVNHALAWLKGRFLFGAVLGGLGGPLAYWSGARLGAVALETPLWFALLAIAVEWALATPTLLFAVDMIERRGFHSGNQPEKEGA